MSALSRYMSNQNINMPVVNNPDPNHYYNPDLFRLLIYREMAKMSYDVQRGSMQHLS
jgi:hypothetical protein